MEQSTTPEPTNPEAELQQFRDKILVAERHFLDVLKSAPPTVNQRWRAVSKTHVQEGRMAAIRSTYPDPNYD